MNGDGGNAGLLELTGEVRGRLAMLIPAEPHLHRNGNAHRPDHGLDQGDGGARVAQEGRTAAAARDLADGAAHVDVHRRRSVSLEPPRSLGQLVRLRTVDLNGQGTIRRCRAN